MHDGRAAAEAGGPAPAAGADRPLLVFLSDALEYPPRLGNQIHVHALAKACARVTPARVLTWVPPSPPGAEPAALPAYMHAIAKPDDRPITKGTKLRYIRWAVSWLERHAPPGSWVWVRGYSTSLLLARALPRLRRPPWRLRFVYDAASILRLEHRPGLGGVADRARGWIEARLWGRYDRLRTLCDPMRDCLVRMGVPAARIGVIPVGCTPQEVVWQPHPGRKRVLYIGSAAAWQGVPNLLAAMRELAARDPSVTLTVVGVEAGEPGLPASGENVRFLGHLPHPEAMHLYLEHDLCIVPRARLPVTETVLPMKVPEALAFGMPLLVTDLPAIRWVTGPDGALFLPDNSPGEIARGLEAALADPAARARTRRAARARAAGLHWDRIAARIRDWLEPEPAESTKGRASGGPADHA